MVVNTQEGRDYDLPRTRCSARGKTHSVANEGKDDHQSIIDDDSKDKFTR